MLMNLMMKIKMLNNFEVKSVDFVSFQLLVFVVHSFYRSYSLDDRFLVEFDEFVAFFHDVDDDRFHQFLHHDNRSLLDTKISRVYIRNPDQQKGKVLTIDEKRKETSGIFSLLLFVELLLFLIDELDLTPEPC